MPDAETCYRLTTTILDPDRAPAAELAALYHERWVIETAFAAFKTDVRGAQRVLRSKTPDLVRQEAWRFFLAHFPLRALMYEAALGARPHARDRTPCRSHTPFASPVARCRIGRPFPLRVWRHGIRPCCTSSARNTCAPAADASCPAGSNAR